MTDAAALEEDDAAPDARHSFEESFRELVGERFEHFKMLAKRAETETGMLWSRNGWVLSYDSTYPYYVLKRE